MDLYSSVETKEIKTINIKFQATDGYGASSNHLQDYNIYKMVIKMFFPKFQNNF
jgi:hypothetical protein